MAVEFKDYYETLGIPRDASDDQIKGAFRRLARRYHPDVAKEKRGAEDKFKEINEAYEVLGNPENRKRYDRLGADWRAGAGFRPPPGWGAGSHGRRRGTTPGGGFEYRFGGTGFSDFFEQFFGRSGRFGDFEGFSHTAADGGGPGQSTGAHRGADVEGSILVTLDEVLHGSVRSVSARWNNQESGRTETQTLKVRVPAGVRENQLIRLAGKGESGGAAGGAGDLYLRVRLASHPDFRVKEDDLYHDLDVAPWEAALGATISVPTLDGRVSVRIPPGTSSGQPLRLRGRGLPRAGGGGPGDLYVIVTIRVPAHLSPEERQLWEQLAQKSHFDPRKK